MSVIFEQPDVTPGISLEAPHPCNPKEASSATAAALPSLSSSRRVNFRIETVRCGPRPKGWADYRAQFDFKNQRDAN
jgi:hypothetical protein